MKAHSLAFGVVAMVLASCGGTTVAKPTAVIDGFDPPIATAGQTVTLYGSNFTLGGAPQLAIGGVAIAPISYTDSEIVMTLPANPPAGFVTVTNAGGTTTSMYPFTPGTPTTVAEVEPNDSVDTATVIGSNRSMTGTLASSTDFDVFSATSLVRNHPYKIHLSPLLAPAVAVSGTTVTFDANGDGTFIPNDQSIIIGLTGNPGTYTMNIEIEPDTP